MQQEITHVCPIARRIRVATTKISTLMVHVISFSLPPCKQSVYFRFSFIETSGNAGKWPDVPSYSVLHKSGTYKRTSPCIPTENFLDKGNTSLFTEFCIMVTPFLVLMLRFVFIRLAFQLSLCKHYGIFFFRQVRKISKTSH